MLFKLQRRNNNMRKVLSLLSILVLAATLSFAGTINYSNQSSSTVQFLRDGNPPGIGSEVIPNGFYSETMPDGVYYLSATNGQQTAPGETCTLNAYNSRCDYRVWDAQSYNVNPNLNLVLASYAQYDGFAVNTPIPLTTAGPTQGTTNAGQAFTATLYSATMPNSDIYAVGVGVYPFAVVDADLYKSINGYAQGVNGTVLTQILTTVSGQPALRAVISAKDTNGREIRFALTITYKGNRTYMFVFGSYVDVVSNEQEFKAFFNSISIN
jgi:hypothetical protein